ncbi:peptide/nickel transport system substrate-binding protein [Nakamurella sp. UYEF19]|uniref:ABC transporter substrate-binding protein n=1 Tax=Nakamurella sp. UYEF19 TaxID=1756392 RepID=UPI003391BE28
MTSIDSGLRQFDPLSPQRPSTGRRAPEPRSREPLSRRRTIGPRWPASAAFVIGAALCVVLAACGGGKPAGAGASVSGAPASPSSVGDTLTVAAQAPATSINPGTVDTAFILYTALAYEPLIYRDSDGNLQPALASAWKYVGTGNTQLDLTIRQGVRFTDGTDVTPQAVQKSLEYMKSAGGNQAQALASIQSIVVAGQTVSIKLSQPNPMLPDMLTQSYGIGQVIGPKGLANPKSLNLTSVTDGAGAYVYDPSASVAGDHYVYTANPGYYDKARQHYKKVVIRVIANPQAALNAVTTKQVDVVVGDFTTVKQAKSAGLQIAQVAFVWDGLNLIDRDGTVSKPLGDVRVRQAINYGIDRQAVTSALLGQYGVATSQVSVQGSDGYSADAASRYPYDPAKAKSLLAAAGYPNGIDLPVLSVHFAGLDTMTGALTAQLAKVGIRLDVTTVSDANSYIGGVTGRQYPVVAVGYGAQPMYLMGQGLFLPAAKVFNGFGTKSPELSKLYTDAAAADATARPALNEKIQDYLVDNAWFAPVAFTPVFYYARTDLGGLKVGAKAPVTSALDWYDTK